MRRAALAALVAMLFVTAVPRPGGAADATSTARLSMRLVAQSPWVNGGGAFGITVAVAGIADTSSLDVAVSIYPRLGSRSEFQSTLSGRIGKRPLKQIVAPLAAVPRDTKGDLTISLPQPRLDTAPTLSTLPTLRDGVYPVMVEVRSRDGVLASLMTHLVRLPDAITGSQLDVAWVQPLSSTPTQARGLGDDDRAGAAALVAALTAARGVPMTLAPTPDTVAALPADTVQTLRAALDFNHPLLATPYVDIDPSAVVAAGQSDDLAAQRETGDDVLAAAVGTRGDPRTWSADRPLTAAALGRLRSLGVSRLVVPESSLKPLNRSLTLANPYSIDTGEGDVVDAASADDGLSGHFRNGGDQVLAAHQLLADLAVLYLDAPGATRGVIVRPPAAWHPTTAFLGAALPALATAPMLRAVTLDTLFDDVPALTSGRTRVIRSLAPNVRPSTLPGTRLTSAHGVADELDALLGTTTNVAVTARRQVLAAESERLSTSQRDALLSGVRATLTQLQGRLHVPNRTFRLTARSGTIPLTVVNDNPFPVRVDIVLSSEKLEFTDVHAADRSRQEITDVVLQPGTLTRTVPVKARASAAFSLLTTVRSPTGTELVRSRITIISTVFSGVGVVLSVGALLFLLLWWGRHWRSSRRDRRPAELDQ